MSLPFCFVMRMKMCQRFIDGFSISVQYDDDLYKRLFHFIKALYVDKVNIDQIKQVFHFLDENKIYAYLEELSDDVAGVFKSKNDHETADEFLMKMLDVQGYCLYSIKKVVLCALAVIVLVSTAGIPSLSKSDNSNIEVASRKQT